MRVRDGGQDPMAALISATSLSAESLNLGNEIGSIAPGMQADIVAFDGNPLQDVTAAGRAVFVMKGGKVYENLAHGCQGARTDRCQKDAAMKRDRLAAGWSPCRGVRCPSARIAEPTDWAFWGGDQGGAHYSTLTDINTGNVSQLRQAWVWKTGETELKEYGTRPGMFENTPVMIDNVMYVTTPV